MKMPSALFPTTTPVSAKDTDNVTIGCLSKQARAHRYTLKKKIKNFKMKTEFISLIRIK